jgi:hypothetical protein
MYILCLHPIRWNLNPKDDVKTSRPTEQGPFGSTHGNAVGRVWNTARASNRIEYCVDNDSKRDIIKHACRPKDHNRTA